VLVGSAAKVIADDVTKIAVSSCLKFMKKSVSENSV
jgi:hypothetical protein